MKITTYLECLHRGIAVAERRIWEVEDRDPHQAIGSHAYACRFFDIASITIEGIEMKSERLNVSPLYYLGGQLMTLEQVEREQPDSILLDNMIGNDWSAVIITSAGHCLPFEDGDVLVEI